MNEIGKELLLKIMGDYADTMRKCMVETIPKSVLTLNDVSTGNSTIKVNDFMNRVQEWISISEVDKTDRAALYAHGIAHKVLWISKLMKKYSSLSIDEKVFLFQQVLNMFVDILVELDGMAHLSEYDIISFFVHQFAYKCFSEHVISIIKKKEIVTTKMQMAKYIKYSQCVLHESYQDIDKLSKDLYVFSVIFLIRKSNNVCIMYNDEPLLFLNKITKIAHFVLFLLTGTSCDHPAPEQKLREIIKTTEIGDLFSMVKI